MCGRLRRHFLSLGIATGSFAAVGASTLGASTLEPLPRLDAAGACAALEKGSLTEYAKCAMEKLGRGVYGKWTQQYDDAWRRIPGNEGKTRRPIHVYAHAFAKTELQPLEPTLAHLARQNDEYTVTYVIPDDGITYPGTSVVAQSQSLPPERRRVLESANVKLRPVSPLDAVAHIKLLLEELPPVDYVIVDSVLCDHAPGNFLRLAGLPGFVYGGGLGYAKFAWESGFHFPRSEPSGEEMEEFIGVPLPRTRTPLFVSWFLAAKPSREILEGWDFFASHRVRISTAAATGFPAGLSLGEITTRGLGRNKHTLALAPLDETLVDEKLVFSSVTTVFPPSMTAFAPEVLEQHPELQKLRRAMGLNPNCKNLLYMALGSQGFQWQPRGVQMLLEVAAKMEEMNVFFYFAALDAAPRKEDLENLLRRGEKGEFDARGVLPTAPTGVDATPDEWRKFFHLGEDVRIPDNVRFTARAPQAELFQAFGPEKFNEHGIKLVYMTGGGINSLGEATQSRVPMACFPLFAGDQPIVCRIVECLGTGVDLGPVSWSIGPAQGNEAHRLVGHTIYGDAFESLNALDGVRTMGDHFQYHADLRQSKNGKKRCGNYKGRGEKVGEKMDGILADFDANKLYETKVSEKMDGILADFDANKLYFEPSGDPHDVWRMRFANRKKFPQENGTHTAHSEGWAPSKEDDAAADDAAAKAAEGALLESFVYLFEEHGAFVASFDAARMDENEGMMTRDALQATVQQMIRREARKEERALTVAGFLQ